MPAQSLTRHDLFWLAHHAHNRLAEPMRQLRAIDPSARLTISINLETGTTDTRYPTLPMEDHLGLAVHWARDGMPLHAYRVTTPDDVEKAATGLERFTADLARGAGTERVTAA